VATWSEKGEMETPPIEIYQVCIPERTGEKKDHPTLSYIVIFKQEEGTRISSIIWGKITLLS